ncbi:hypothetical protein quinque_013912 [Culex quinquefasciatus]
MKRYRGGRFVKWPPENWEVDSEGNQSSDWEVSDSIGGENIVESTRVMSSNHPNVAEGIQNTFVAEGIQNTSSEPPRSIPDRQLRNVSSDPPRALGALPQFPKNVPHGLIWETFTAYLEKFNLSLSLYHVSDSAQKAKLLYLAMGDDLQEIVRTNGLRPSLGDPECYEKMIKNIESYFRSLTDASAEHDAFGEMKQGPDEPVMKFVARLKSKVSACGYHTDDEERFVRSQFLKGMIDQSLAEHARIHNHALGELISNAHRAENLASKRKEALAKEAQARGALVHESFALQSGRASGRLREQNSLGRAKGYHEREQTTRRYGPGDTSGNGRSSGGYQEYGRNSGGTRGQGSRGRDIQRNEGNGPGRNRSSSARVSNGRKSCPNCYSDHNDREPCPATDRKCWRCNGVGHFASACRLPGSRKFARQIERDNSRDQV